MFLPRSLHIQSCTLDVACFLAQGAMQGALFGARSLGTGFGPILFATVFSMFSRTDSPLPFFPGKAPSSPG